MVSELAEMYARLLDVVTARPRTRTSQTVDGEVDQEYADLLNQLAR